MIKKLVIAAAFAASLTVGVPSASASNFICMQQYQAALADCGNDELCQLAANRDFLDCLDRLENVEQ